MTPHPARRPPAPLFSLLLLALLLPPLSHLRAASPDAPATSANPAPTHPLGSWKHPAGIHFRVWAPNAETVELAGEFNDWGRTPMQRHPADGTWSVIHPAARVGQRYKYVINGTLWKRDPRARQVNHSSGDSVIYDPAAFDWQGDRPLDLPHNELVLYQLHIGTFAGIEPPATFDHAIPLLPRLQKLGINGIQLMPVNEFPGGLSWGYNPSDPFAIETDYGGPDALKRFVRAAHRLGIAVFVDIVHNHYGPTDLDLWTFDGWHQRDLGGIYFYNDNRAHTPWGSTRPDYTRPEIRQFIRDQVLLFADEYHIDGYRWDSVYHILHTDSGPNPDGPRLLRDINQLLAHTRPHLLRIAEDHAFDHPVHYPAQWDIGHRWALYNQIATAWDHERDIHTLAGTLRDWPGHHRVIFTEAHDYVAAMNDNRTRVPSTIHPDDPESIWARRRALLGAAVLFTTPGIPMIFQGQEMHETLPFHDTTPLRWSRAQTHAGILQAYTDLIRLRRNLTGTTPALLGTGIHVHHLDHDNKVIGWIRWNRGNQTDDAVIIANFSSTHFDQNDYTIPLPSPGTWHRHRSTDSTQYSPDFHNSGTPTLRATGTPPAATLILPPYTLQIYTQTPPHPPISP